MRAARDLRLRRTVAIKLLDARATPDDPAARRRFVREARAAASFSHPHAVAVFDAGDADGYLYLVMELVDGRSLADRIAGGGALPIDDAVGVIDDVLQALGAAHRAGIVHRDVKPGNVLVTATGPPSSPTSASPSASATEISRSPASSSARRSTSRPSRSAAVR